MPVFSRLLESRSVNNPTQPLTSSNLIQVLGGSQTNSGAYVTEKNALTISAVYRAVALIAGSVAGLPLNAYKLNNVKPVPNKLLDEPTPGMTDYEFWETVLTHLLLWGNFYGQKIYTKGDYIGEIIPILPWRVRPKLVEKTLINPEAKEFEVDGLAGGPLTTRDIFHIPGMGYDGVRGLSPIQLAKQGLGVALSAEEAAGKFFASGSMMSGVLQTDAKLDQATAEAIKRRWQEKVGGVQKAHEVAVLDAGVKFQPLSIPPDDAQWLVTREFQITDIARWYGLPPHLLGHMQKTTSWGSGVEQMGTAYVIYTLAPWLKRIERRVTKELLTGRNEYAKFNATALLRGDTATRFAAYSQARQWGWISVNEIREKEDMEPVDGGDVYLQPVNMTDSNNPITPQSPFGGDNANQDSTLVDTKA